MVTGGDGPAPRPPPSADVVTQQRRQHGSALSRRAGVRPGYRPENCRNIPTTKSDTGERQFH